MFWSSTQFVLDAWKNDFELMGQLLKERPQIATGIKDLTIVMPDLGFRIPHQAETEYKPSTRNSEENRNREWGLYEKSKIDAVVRQCGPIIPLLSMKTLCLQFQIVKNSTLNVVAKDYGALEVFRQFKVSGSFRIDLRPSWTRPWIEDDERTEYESMLKKIVLPNTLREKESTDTDIHVGSGEANVESQSETENVDGDESR